MGCKADFEIIKLTPQILFGGDVHWLRFLQHLELYRQPHFSHTLYFRSLFIFPPPHYATMIYMIYGRIVHFVNTPPLSPIRPTRATKVFTTGEPVAFPTQAKTENLLTPSGMVDIGNKLVLVGLFIQLGLFGFLIVELDHRINKSWRWLGGTTVPSYGKYYFKVMMKTLYGAAVLIIFWCIFWVAEFS